MNRASVELLVQRRPKKYSGSLQKNSKENDKKDYKKIFKQFKEEQQFAQAHDFQNHSDEEDMGTNEKGPEGIKHFRLLKEHPKLLNFAIQRIKSKDIELKKKTRRE